MMDVKRKLTEKDRRNRIEADQLFSQWKMDIARSDWNVQIIYYSLYLFVSVSMFTLMSTKRYYAAAILFISFLILIASSLIQYFRKNDHRFMIRMLHLFRYDLRSSRLQRSKNTQHVLENIESPYAASTLVDWIELLSRRTDRDSVKLLQIIEAKLKQMLPEVSENNELEPERWRKLCRHLSHSSIPDEIMQAIPANGNLDIIREMAYQYANVCSYGEDQFENSCKNCVMRLLEKADFLQDDPAYTACVNWLWQLSGRIRNNRALSILALQKVLPLLSSEEIMSISPMLTSTLWDSLTWRSISKEGSLSYNVSLNQEWLGPPYWLAVIQAAEKAGDISALPYLNDLARGRCASHPESKVAKAAKKTLSTLIQIAGRQIEGRELLRSGIAPQQQSILLRASVFDNSASSEQLLRSSSEGVVKEQSVNP